MQQLVVILVVELFALVKLCKAGKLLHHPDVDELLPKIATKQNFQISALLNKLNTTSLKNLNFNEIKPSAEDNDDKNYNENDNDEYLSHLLDRPVTTNVNSQMMMIQDELMGNTWDYRTELVFALLLAILAIPANIFLFTFYTQKVRRYKRLKHFNLRYASIANSFHTYLIEICLFDTLIVIYLILDSCFHLLSFLKKSPYESVFDVSNFACKFFTYILRISGAMSNYLVFLLSLNRCFLLLFRHKHDEVNSHRLCLNTKYLTLFLFCICTIANVFRLELLNLSSHLPSNHSTSSNLNQSVTIIQQLVTTNNMNNNNNNKNRPEFDSSSGSSLSAAEMEWANEFVLQLLLKENEQTPGANNSGINLLKKAECGPDIRSIQFNFGDRFNDKLFWSIIIYNIMFVIMPTFGNFGASVYLIKKRGELKDRLIRLTESIEKLKMSAPELSLLKDQFDNQNNDSINNKFEVGPEDIQVCQNESCSNYIDLSLIRDIKRLQLTEYHAEFLKTCSPCIAFSLTHVFLFLPYACIEMINQFETRIALVQALQYMTYVRYLFYCCKFYLLFFVSYRFRSETFEFFRFKGNQRNMHLLETIRQMHLARKNKNTESLLLKSDADDNDNKCEYANTNGDNDLVEDTSISNGNGMNEIDRIGIV